MWANTPSDNQCALDQTQNIHIIQPHLSLTPTELFAPKRKHLTLHKTAVNDKIPVKYCRSSLPLRL